MAFTIADIPSQSTPVGTEVNMPVVATESDDSTKTAFKSSDLPPGLKMNAVTGVIWGTPTTAGTYSTARVWLVNADDQVVIPNTEKTINWEITPAALTLGSIGDQQHFEGEDVHLPIQWSGPTNVRFAGKRLPRGLKINEDTGVIAGTARRAGDYPGVQVIAWERGNRRATRTFEEFTWTVQETLDVSEKWFKVETPNYNESDDANAMKRSYLRMGSPDTDYEKSFMLGGAAYVKDGSLEYTDGNRVSETKQDRYTLTHGNEYHLVEGQVQEVVEGESWKWTDQLNYEFKLGFDTEVAFAGQFSSLIGAAAEFFLGPKYEASIGLGAVSTNLGFEITHGAAWKYEATLDSDITLSREIEGEANDKIHYTVDPDDTGWEKYYETAAPILASIGVGLVGIPAAVASGIDIAARATTSDKGWNEGLSTAAKTTASVGHAASVATWLYGVVTAIADAIRRRKKPDDPRTELLMDKDRIELALKQPIVPAGVASAAGAVAAGAAAAAPPATEGRAIADPDALVSMTSDQISLKCGEFAEIILNKAGDIELKGTNIIIGSGVTGNVTIAPLGHVEIKPTQFVDINPTGYLDVKGAQRIL